MMGYGGFGEFSRFGNFGWIGMILGLVVTVAILIALVLLVIWLVRRFSHNATPTNILPSGGQPAKDIAQARYARGEISREEYQQIISDLSQ